MTTATAILCPGQGAQFVGMGRAWNDKSPAAARVFKLADEVLGDTLGATLSALCFNGPETELNKTNVSQPAIYVCSVACARGLEEQGKLPTEFAAAAGLSLGEYTALHLAGAFSFEDGLQLVATRGRLMQDAAEASSGGMVALIGAEPEQAEALCEQVTSGNSGGQVLVCANFNAPGQIVLSGHLQACERAVEAAKEMKLVAKPLAVAGAFHSPLMQPAADEMAAALASAPMKTPNIPVYSNVTAAVHPMDGTEAGNVEQLRQRLVEQIVRPVRWAESCQGMIAAGMMNYLELAPNKVLRGLMRRIDRTAEVISHDEPEAS